MEHANSSAALRQQQHYQHQHYHHLHQQQQEQLNQSNHQQFCLRWHNHQTSLLSTLPILLDQSHLTDVTLSAEGRTLRAHRVVLSACSTFFLELFRALDSSNHPVIIIPGASFAAIVALLTFMYSGEVNVFEEQIPMLLNLAETLGIKGLADVQSNLQNTTKRRDEYPPSTRKDDETPPSPRSPQPQQPPPPPNPSTAQHHQQQHQQQQQQLPSSALPQATPMPTKLPTPLESFFLKSLQFYPNLIPQPLNFSQSALNKTTEFLAKYQQHCNLYQGSFSAAVGHSSNNTGGGGGDGTKDHCNQNADQQAAVAMQVACPATATNNDDTFNKRTCTGEKKLKDIKRIDKIVENLRSASSSAGIKAQCDNLPMATYQQQSSAYSSIKTSLAYGQPMSATMVNTKPSIYLSASATPSHGQQQQNRTSSSSTTEEQSKMQQHQQKSQPTDQQGAASAATANFSTANNRATPEISVKNETGNVLDNSNKTTPALSPQTSKSAANSKIYATCFICHKQLSNQYNLRVHLETHQNVRYACSVCSHVSRSKDALRKHVSYRHPGAPSPCESEARRKRSKASNPNSLPTSAPSSFQIAANNQDSDAAQMAAVAVAAAAMNPAYMFMPNQFHLAAAAAVASSTAAVAAQQQQQQLQTGVAKSPTSSSTPSIIATTSYAAPTELAPPTNSPQTSTIASNEICDYNKLEIPASGSNGAGGLAPSSPPVNP